MFFNHLFCRLPDAGSAAIVPAVEVPAVKETKLGIIGAVEPVYFLPMRSPFEARIDTGAENSAIDVTSLKTFERDGEKWVSFVLVNDETGEKTPL